MGLLRQSAAPLAAGLLYSDEAEGNWVKKGAQEFLNIWHGGGDFDALDFKFIGSGEGTSAYSRGFYGADRKDTSLGYGESYLLRRAGVSLDDDQKYRQISNVWNNINTEEKGPYRLLKKQIETAFKNSDFLTNQDIEPLIRNYDFYDGRFLYNRYDQQLRPASSFRDQAMELVEDNIQKIVGPNSKYSSQYYLKPQGHPDDGLEPPLAKNAAEAAMMAARKRTEDGISKEQYRKYLELNRIKKEDEIYKSISNDYSQLSDAIYNPAEYFEQIKRANIFSDKKLKNIENSLTLIDKDFYFGKINEDEAFGQKSRVLLNSLKGTKADEQFVKDAVDSAEQTLRNFADTIDKNILGRVARKRAFLYNIDLPGIKRENVLLWDFPISNQPKAKEVFKKIAETVDKPSKENNIARHAFESFLNIVNEKPFDMDEFKKMQLLTLVGRKEVEGLDNFGEMGVGQAIWLLERSIGPRKTAELLAENGIQASSHLNRQSRRGYKAIPFNKRKYSEDDDFNHVIYTEEPIKILSKEQLGNADPKLLAAIAGFTGGVSAMAQVEGLDTDEAGMPQIKRTALDYLKEDPLVDAAKGLFSGVAQATIDSLAPMGRPVNPYNPVGQAGVLTEQQLKSTPEIEKLKEKVTGGSKVGQFVGGLFSPI